MSRLDELPADRRAALSLLLQRRKSYAEVSKLLGIAERAVHDRAHAALAVLAPREARELGAGEREEIGEYLLGQQPLAGERLRTRNLLSGSPQARAWARALVAELGPLADGNLPEIPDADDPAPQEPYPLSRAAEAPAAPAGGAPAASSRRGGAILLAVLAVAVVVVVIVIVSSGSSGPKTTSTSSTSSTSTTGPKQEGRIALHPSPGAHSASTGAVEILSEGEKKAFYIQAEHIPETKGFFYAVWLYNSPSSSLPLSKSPPVGANHKLAGAALLPSNAGKYKEILLTQETSTRPKHPGRVVLRGTLSLGG